MKKRIGALTAALFLVAVVAASGAGVARAGTVDRGACDVASPGDLSNGYFSGGSAEGVLVLKSDGTLRHFVCQGTVPDLGLLTGAHGAHVIGTLALTAGGTTVVAAVDCVVNTAGSNDLKFVCAPSP